MIKRAVVLWDGLKNVGFIRYNIMDFITTTLVRQRYHMGLLLSVWPYLTDWYGKREAIELLEAIKAKCEILFFETQLHGDGPGPEELVTDNDVVEMLANIPGVVKVEEIVTIPVAGRDAARTVFMVS